jgi:hypothetical protein
MKIRPSQSPSSYIPSALLLALIGWGGLAMLILFTLPTVFPRWLFFFLSVIAFSGTVMPFIAYLHFRFPSKAPIVPGVIFRQSVWVGVYGATLIWLQIGRILSISLGLLLAFGFIVIEWLLRLRERSRWSPGETE